MRPPVSRRMRMSANAVSAPASVNSAATTAVPSFIARLPPFPALQAYRQQVARFCGKPAWTVASPPGKIGIMLARALTIALTAGSALMVATAAKAAEIKVMCSGAMRPALEELAPQFERESGHKLAITYAGTNVIRERALAGDAGDLVIFAGPAVEDVVRQGKLAAKVDLVRSGVGVGVRAGSPHPDLSSAEAFKRTLLAAKSFSRSEGPSGTYIAGLLERMGIAEQMKPKTVVVRGRLVGDALVKGEAEIGVQ